MCTQLFSYRALTLVFILEKVEDRLEWAFLGSDRRCSFDCAETTEWVADSIKLEQIRSMKKDEVDRTNFCRFLFHLSTKKSHNMFQQPLIRIDRQKRTMPFVPKRKITRNYVECVRLAFIIQIHIKTKAFLPVQTPLSGHALCSSYHFPWERTALYEQR